MNLHSKHRAAQASYVPRPHVCDVHTQFNHRPVTICFGVWGACSVNGRDDAFQWLWACTDF